VIGHDHEVVNGNPSRPHGRPQNIYEEIPHAFGLKQ
jgi:hypothetical protein